MKYNKGFLDLIRHGVVKAEDKKGCPPYMLEIFQMIQEMTEMEPSRRMTTNTFKGAMFDLWRNDEILSDAGL